VSGMDLSEFLLARIGEDEEAAQAATPGPWEARPYWSASLDDSWASVPDIMPEPIDARDASHIARWDPARVLAECAAKRRIVELVEPYVSRMAGEVLELLALPYAGHEDYDPAWQPEETA
jgi:hypothetical protein